MRPPRGRRSWRRRTGSSHSCCPCGRTAVLHRRGCSWACAGRSRRGWQRAPKWRLGRGGLKLRRDVLEDAEDLKEALAVVDAGNGHALQDHVALQVVALGTQPQLHRGACHVAPEEQRTNGHVAPEEQRANVVHRNNVVTHRNLPRPRGRRAWQEVGDEASVAHHEPERGMLRAAWRANLEEGPEGARPERGQVRRQGPAAGLELPPQVAQHARTFVEELPACLVRERQLRHRGPVWRPGLSEWWTPQPAVVKLVLSRLEAYI